MTLSTKNSYFHFFKEDKLILNPQISSLRQLVERPIFYCVFGHINFLRISRFSRDFEKKSSTFFYFPRKMINDCQNRIPKHLPHLRFKREHVNLSAC